VQLRHCTWHISGLAKGSRAAQTLLGNLEPAEPFGQQRIHDVRQWFIRGMRSEILCILCEPVRKTLKGEKRRILGQVCQLIRESRYLVMLLRRKNATGGTDGERE
jgi:hypothetical protein